MYAVWQDAQINSKLVKKGFGMSPLRAAFVITAAAMDRTGLNNRGLLQIKNKSLYAELYGQKKHERATVSKDIFRSDDDDHGKSEVWLRKRSEDSRSSDA